MKYTFNEVVNVGDLRDRIPVGSLEIESISLRLDPQSPCLSVVLRHAATGWQHTETYRDTSAVEFWARTWEKEFDAIGRGILEKLAAEGKLPAGSVSEAAT